MSNALGMIIYTDFIQSYLPLLLHNYTTFTIIQTLNNTESMIKKFMVFALVLEFTAFRHIKMAQISPEIASPKDPDKNVLLPGLTGNKGGQWREISVGYTFGTCAWHGEKSVGFLAGRIEITVSIAG